MKKTATANHRIHYAVLIASMCLVPGLAGPLYASGDHHEHKPVSQAGPGGGSTGESAAAKTNIFPASVLADQSKSPVTVVPIEEAIKIALQAAKNAAVPLIDTKFHDHGRTLTVPTEYQTIQAALDAAQKGDVVLVKAGTYYEQIDMKDGVKLISDQADGGDELVSVDGSRVLLPRRALRTIIEGSKGDNPKHGVFDFEPGLGRKTIIDGFTIQSLAEQNHHIPGHAHGLNVRGASPVITNCLIQNMGSTGIGFHSVFKDQGKSVDQRDFRRENVKLGSSGVVYNNIVRFSIGLGIGSNHYSNAFVLGNEVMHNSDAKLGTPSPGIGNKHGSAATIIGNIVYDNAGGGISCGKGEPQGEYMINEPTHPKVLHNVIFNTGNVRAGLSCSQAGSAMSPVEFRDNYIYNPVIAGVSLVDGTGIIEGNMVSGSMGHGITVDGSTVATLNGNKVTGSRNNGITIRKQSVVFEMKDNGSDKNSGVDFFLNDAKIGR